MMQYPNQTPGNQGYPAGNQNGPSYPPYTGGSYPNAPDPLEQARLNPVIRPIQPTKRPRRRLSCCSNLLLAPILIVCLLFTVYLLFPGRTNILVIGIDARPEEGTLGRSDTNILATFDPIKPYVGALSIPRDLWVAIPGYGENRINTAHFFAEAAEEGRGPAGAMEAVTQNFGVDIDYYARLKFSGFSEVVDAMGGVDVDFPQEMLGLPAGTHHLNGEQALALVRDRTSGGDDFSRMSQGQLFLKAVWKQMMRPASWVRLPMILAATAKAVDTNIPPWQWPRLALAILRVGPDDIDFRSINREMVTPWTTEAGANVLIPNWDAINPMLMEVFEQ